MTPQERAIRQSLIDTCRSMNALGINRGTSGNVSLRHGSGLLITPTGIPYDDLQPEQIVQLDWDGNFEGDFLPSSEWRFHRDILLARTDLQALVHTHSTNATTVSILGKDIPAIHYLIASAGGNSIRCAPYATFGTQELADHMLVAMEGRRACLMGHHGMLAGHVSLPRALSLAVTVEELATQYLQCLPFGEPACLSDEEVEDLLVRFRSYGQQPRV